MSKMFLRTEVRESPESVCLLRVILRLQSEHILAPGPVTGSMSHPAQPDPNHRLNTGDQTHTHGYTHIHRHTLTHKTGARIDHKPISNRWSTSVPKEKGCLF